jgi:hypothetical protein
MTSRLPVRAAALAAVAVLALAGCGDDANPSSPGDTATTAPGVTPPVSSEAANECGGAATEIREKLTATEIQEVEITGQCTTVVVTTSLGDADAARAKEICDNAAEVAYTGNVNSVRVEGSSGKELSQGVSGAPCLASP